MPHLVPHRPGIEARSEALAVETDAGRVAPECRGVQVVLRLQERVVVRPVGALRGGAGGGLRGDGGVAMHRLREVAHHQADVPRVDIEHAPQDRLHRAAVRALEVEELDDRHGRIGRTAHGIVVGIDRDERRLRLVEQDGHAGGGELLVDEPLRVVPDRHRRAATMYASTDSPSAAARSPRTRASRMSRSRVARSV